MERSGEAAIGGRARVAAEAERIRAADLVLLTRGTSAFCKVEFMNIIIRTFSGQKITKNKQ